MLNLKYLNSKYSYSIMPLTFFPIPYTNYLTPLYLIPYTLTLLSRRKNFR